MPTYDSEAKKVFARLDAQTEDEPRPRRRPSDGALLRAAVICFLFALLMLIWLVGLWEATK